MEPKQAKISIIGAGQIGGIVSLLIAQKELGNVVLFDIVDGMPLGKALDQTQLSAIEGLDGRIKGTNNYADIANSDVVVVIAGVPRKPGMSRDELVNINADVMRQVGSNIKREAPNSFVICVTNPLDVMVQVLQRSLGFPTHRVVGMAGVLDTARYRGFLAEKLDVSVDDIQTVVLGGHGDSMVPVSRMTSVGGIPLDDLIQCGMITSKEIEDIEIRTRDGGAEVLSLLKTGSAYHAPAAAVTQMVESYLKNKKRVLPCCAYLKGEFGINGFYIGVPVVIGSKGVERIIDLPLRPDEKQRFQASAQKVVELHEKLQSQEKAAAL